MHSRFIKFFISRLFGTLVDTAILWILTRFIFYSYTGQYLVAPAISFEVAMFNNYIFSYYWIWKKYIPVKSARDFLIRLVPYNISCILGFLIKMGFLLLFEIIFGWHVVYCNIAALIISGGANFFLAELVVFKKHAHLPISDDYTFVEGDNENTIESH